MGNINEDSKTYHAQRRISSDFRAFPFRQKEINAKFDFLFRFLTLFKVNCQKSSSLCPCAPTVNTTVFSRCSTVIAVIQLKYNINFILEYFVESLIKMVRSNLNSLAELERKYSRSHLMKILKYWRCLARDIQCVCGNWRERRLKRVIVVIIVVHSFPGDFSQSEAY